MVVTITNGNHVSKLTGGNVYLDILCLYFLDGCLFQIATQKPVAVTLSSSRLSLHLQKFKLPFFW